MERSIICNNLSIQFGSRSSGRALCAVKKRIVCAAVKKTKSATKAETTAIYNARIIINKCPIDREIVWKDYKKSSSRVGKNYQVTCLPHVGYDDGEDEVEKIEYYQQWNLAKASTCAQSIDVFMQDYAYGREDLGMIAVHTTDYNISKNDNSTALSTLSMLMQEDKDCTDWSQETKDMFHACLLYDVQRKDFPTIAAKLGESPNRCMIYYYSTFKSHPDYAKFKTMIDGKQKRKKRSDSCTTDSDDEEMCHICDDGGNLIICDMCDKAFHPSCLKPPLSFADIPEGDWFCHNCVDIRNNKNGTLKPSSGELMSSKRTRNARTTFYVPG
eukprot:CAMPEP_0116042858 /NCGR_PEP_ID=MMETSP0321-20121206/25975_1 /TAXON_ID=163516 /ORGANISM="Leptocylindrus danicus var. danicus, Strain B650" /LENGTH=327 /DNA_ID=CAMNT_0003523485 /DNA_START=317 /DNA_END=1300 /DNA_ORIENTATION=-